MGGSTVKYYLDKRRAIGNGSYPLKIVVYHANQSYIPTGYYFTSEQWAIIQNSSINKNSLFNSSTKSNDSAEVISGIRKELEEKYNKVCELLKELEATGTPFKASDIKDRMTRVKYDKHQLQYLKKCHLEYIDKLEKKGASSKTIKGYTSTIAVLKSYYEGISNKNSIDDLRFLQVDYSFLKGYEAYLLKKGDTQSTVSAHNRYIKVLFNYAIGQQAITKDIYPYGKGDGHYTIKSVKKTKKALSVDELTKFINYRPKLLERQRRNFDLAILSFLLNGANLIDIAQLTYKNNYNSGAQTIHFVRTKTINATSEATEITVPISEDIKLMIDLYGNTKKPDNYIFNILRPSDDTPSKIRDRVQNTIRAINKTLKRVAKKCGVREDISYQFFRHTHATFLISRANAKAYDIMVSMGHRDIKTTALYISSLPDDNHLFVEKKHELLNGVYGKNHK